MAYQTPLSQSPCPLSEFIYSTSSGSLGCSPTGFLAVPYTGQALASTSGLLHLLFLPPGMLFASLFHCQLLLLIPHLSKSLLK